MTMKGFGFGIIGLIVIGATAPATAQQQTYDLTLQATAGFPPTGTGSFTIDAPPPGADLLGLFLQGPPGGGSPGNELLDMSFDFGGDIFDFSNENAAASASVQFNSSGNLISVGYLGTDSSGNALFINLLDYTLSGPTLNSSGAITSATLVPEPASMALMTAALIGIVAVRRHRHT
jgi:hypothetical protein